MNNRRGQLFQSPALVGAITTLVIVIAVFLAYNANNGLPFVPTRQLHVQLANGGELVKGNEVREGGFRVGIVDAMSPSMLPNGTVGALVTLKLDRSAGAIPVDSSVVIRPRSALGLEYVELTRGSSPTTIPDGGTLPIANTSQEVELDQVYGMFDKPTRIAAQTNTREFGDAFTGRGSDLNATIAELPRTLGLLEPVARNLASAQSNLAGFFPALERTAGAVAPVAGPLAQSFTTMADTWSAISADPKALQDTISKQPGTLVVGTDSFRTQIPFLQNAAAFAVDLNAATTDLRAALPTLNSALRVGIPVTRRSPALYQNLQPVFNSLRALALEPTTNAALRGLEATVATLQPQIRFLGPYVTVCNYWNTFWTLIGEHFSAPATMGSAQRSIVDFGSQQDNSYGTAGAAVPANGENVKAGTPTFYHGAPYGHAVDSAGRADCLYGQTGYIHRAFKYGSTRFNIDTDPKAPDFFGAPLGSTYATYLKGGGGQGRNTSRVPTGETFTPLPGGIAPPVLP